MENLALNRCAPWQRRLARYLTKDGNLSRLEVSPRYEATALKLAGHAIGLPARSWPCLVHPEVWLIESQEREAFTSLPHLAALAADGTTAGVLIGGDLLVLPSCACSESVQN